jgi:hypothetical protein
MLYAIYKPDGSIYQSNKVWHASDADKKFEDGIRDLGQCFVKKETPYVLSPDNWFVNVTAEELIERPVMPIEQSKDHMRAGSDDFMRLTGIPQGAKYRIMAGATEYLSGQLDPDGTEIDLSVPVPCTCTVVIDKWPYRTHTATVEVHA